jgi:hypothetical protein
LQAVLPSLSAQELGQVLWALVSLRVRPQEEWMEDYMEGGWVEGWGHCSLLKPSEDIDCMTQQPECKLSSLEPQVRDPVVLVRVMTCLPWDPSHVVHAACSAVLLSLSV